MGYGIGCVWYGGWLWLGWVVFELGRLGWDRMGRGN